VLYSVSGSPISDDREQLAVCCHTDPGEWGMVLPFTGGSAYDWLHRTIPVDDAATAGGAPPPLFIPHLYGGLSPDWRGQSKGSLVGLTLSHTARDIEAALMRGLAFEARRNLEAAERLGGCVDSVRMVGGAGRSDVWPQLIANVLDRPVELTERLESACYGAARLAAGATAADWPDADAVRECRPQPPEVEAENARYAQYLECYQALLPIYESEGEQP
jgi:xylulokinase